MTVYTLSYSSYSLEEGVLDGGVIDIFECQSDAQHEMELNVKETSSFYDDNNHKELVIRNGNATFETKDGYLIEYKITAIVKYGLIKNYMYNLALNYFLNDDEFSDDAETFATENCETTPYSNEHCYKLFSRRFDIEPILVVFNNQCCSTESTKLFFNKGENILYYLENWKEYII